MPFLMQKCLLPLIVVSLLNTTAVSAPKTNTIEAQSFSGAYLAGRVARSQMQLDTASDYFRLALKYWPDNQQAQKDAFITLLASGYFDEATHLAKNLLEDPDFGFFAILVSTVENMRNGRYSLIKINKKSDKFSAPELLQLSILEAWTLLGQNKLDQAISLTKGLSVSDKWLLNFQIALMYDVSNKPKEAEKYYINTFKEADINQQAPYIFERIVIAYASFLQHNHKQKEARDLLELAKAKLPNSYSLQFYYKKAEQGKQIPSPVKNAAAGVAEVFYALGTLITPDNAEIAQIYFQLALALKPNEDIILFQLGDIASRLGSHSRAISYYSRIPKGSPYYLDAQLRIALAYTEDGNDEKAIGLFSALEGDIPNDLRISMVLTGLYMRLEQFNNAEKILNRAISSIKATKPSDWILYYQRGISFERQKEWGKAEPDFRKALELYPNQPEVLNYLGYSLIDRDEKLDEAVEMINKAVSLRQNDGFIVDSLGWAFYKLERYDDAVKELEKAAMLQPSDPTINDHLGDAYWKIGRKRDAVFQWTYALAFKPEEKDIPKIEEKLKHGLVEHTDATNNEKNAEDASKTPPEQAGDKEQQKTPTDDK